MDKINVLGFCGSLRQHSYNRAILEAAIKLTPVNVNLTIFDRVEELPPFNQDKEKDPPPVVIDLKNQIRQSDAILIATPEYNYSFPGVLKNVIDWASRPYGDNSWEGKPAALMSASIGTYGGVRAQLQLRQTFVFLDMHPLNRPEVLVGDAARKINDNGNVTDSHTREKIEELLQALAAWTIELKVDQKVLNRLAEKFPYEAAYLRQNHKK